MSYHMANTWLLANLLHPVVMFFYFNDSGFPTTAAEIGSVLQFMVYTLIFSLPSLLLSFLAGHLLLRMNMPVISRYLLWLVTAPLIVLLNFTLLMLVLAGGWFSIFDIQVAVPAMLAVLMVVLLRYHSFSKIFNHSNQESDESNMV